MKEHGSTSKKGRTRPLYGLFWNETRNTKLTQTPCPHIHNHRTRWAEVGSFTLWPLYSRENKQLERIRRSSSLRASDQTSVVFLIPAMRATCPAQLIQLYCIILILHGISFITTSSTTAIPRRKPASVGIPRDNWGAQDDRRNALYVLNTTNYEIINYILLFILVLFFVAQHPISGLGRLTNYVTSHTWENSTTRVISPSQRPLPTQHTTNTLDTTPLNEWSARRRGHCLHNTQQTPSIRLLWTSYQLVAEATAYTTHNKHTRYDSSERVIS
jgi:hypothetical protein